MLTAFTGLAREDLIASFWDALERARTPDDFARLDRKIRRTPRWILKPAEFDQMHNLIARRERFFCSYDERPADAAEKLERTALTP